MQHFNTQLIHTLIETRIIAERYPEVLAVADPIESHINQCFDHLVVCIDHRRIELLTEYREKKEKRRAKETARLRTRQQLDATLAQIQNEMNENSLQSVRERMVGEIEERMQKLETTVRDLELSFEFETRKMEDNISRLGQLVERVVVPNPDYANLKQPRISICKRGYVPGKLNWPRSIAYDTSTQLVYVVDYNNKYLLSGRICAFCEKGEYINTFAETHLKSPIGIGISSREVFVSDEYLHTIFHFELPNFLLVAKVGMKGTGKHEFSSPRQLAVDTNEDVYVADEGNNRVVVMNSKLNYKQSIQHSTMTLPRDVKLLEDKVFVLSWKDNPCLHEFSKAGNKLRSFISHGMEYNEQVRQGYYFCFDNQNNILISDRSAGCIKVFSQEGTLLHIVGVTKEEEKRVKPVGILITPNDKIICASSSTIFRLHIFY